MRIRKHAKVSPLLYASSSLKQGTVNLQPHVCELNQSMWDVVVFPPEEEDPDYLPPPPPPPSPPPPSAFAFNDYDNFAARNMSSIDFISAVEIAPPTESSLADNNATEWVGGGGVAAAVKTIGKMRKNEEEVVYAAEAGLCSKTDESGWQCGRGTKNGLSFCEYHSEKLQGNSSHPLPRKAEKQAAKTVAPPPEQPSRRRPRPKKAANSSSSNPYDFYYYSGFGPRWGKRRGTGRADPISDQKIANIDMSKFIEQAEHVTSRQDDYLTRSNSSESQIDNERFDYVEDEDDEDEEDDGESGPRKRARKPIKARSLKSLM